MEKTTWSGAKKVIAALFAMLIAGCCMVLAGCAENSEEAVRDTVTEELNKIKEYDAATIEELATNTNEFQSLSAFGITPSDAYEAIFSDFDYQIENVKVEGDTATVSIKFTTKDLAKFAEALATAVQTAQSDGSLTGMSQEQTNEAVGKLVIQAIKDLPTTETQTIDFECLKQDGKWRMASDSGEIFQEALFPSSIMNTPRR